MSVAELGSIASVLAVLLYIVLEWNRIRRHILVILILISLFFIMMLLTRPVSESTTNTSRPLANSINPTSPVNTYNATATPTVVPSTPTALMAPASSNTPSIPIVIHTVAPSPVPTSTGCIDNSQFVTDVTIHDNSILQAGIAFNKVWRIRNTGTCIWNNDYQFAFISGTRMSDSAWIAYDEALLPGENRDVAVRMVSPRTSGTFTGTWRMRNKQGELFGDIFTVQIVVAPSPTQPPRLGPVDTPLPTPPPATSTPIQQQSEVRITVNAQDAWTSTGITLETQDRVTIRYLFGLWTTNPVQYPPHNATGSGYICSKVRKDCVETIPDFPQGALIGRCNAQLIRVGNSVTFTATQRCLLQLGINDTPEVWDNTGSVIVAITVAHP